MPQRYISYSAVHLYVHSEDPAKHIHPAVLALIKYEDKQAWKTKSVDTDQTPQNAFTLFATHQTILDTFTGSIMDLLEF